MPAGRHRAQVISVCAPSAKVTRVCLARCALRIAGRRGSHAGHAPQARERCPQNEGPGPTVTFFTTDEIPGGVTVLGSGRKRSMLRLHKIICESSIARINRDQKQINWEEWMLLARSMAVGISTLALAAAMATFGYAVDIKQVKLYPDKKGTVADLQPMSKFCGTKPIKVALADGWGGNYWRHITRAEFEDEASKCKNITETKYTD